MIYLSEFLWTHSWDVDTLVPNNSEFISWNSNIFVLPGSNLSHLYTIVSLVGNLLRPLVLFYDDAHQSRCVGLCFELWIYPAIFSVKLAFNKIILSWNFIRIICSLKLNQRRHIIKILISFTVKLNMKEDYII